MAVSVRPKDAETGMFSVEEFVACYEDARIDTSDPSSLIEAAPLLAALARNKSFLADTIVAELESDLNFQMANNGYSSQVIMLQSQPNYMIRANLWPSPMDEIYRQNRPETFFYNVPHDHNFNLLTVGYLGPGYESDEYCYDYDMVDGYPGEELRLRFEERRRLNEGDIVLYRAGQDVHNQLPPEALSISLNIVDASPEVFFREQYVLESDVRHLRCVVSHRCNPALFSVAAIAGGDEARARLEHIFRNHDSDFVRMQALIALAGAAPDDAETAAVLAQGLDQPSTVLREWSRRQLTRRAAEPSPYTSNRMTGSTVGSNQMQ